MIDKSLISEDYSFTTYDKLGNEVICDTLAIIEYEDNPVIIYTDYTLDNDNKYNLFVSKVVEADGNFTLEEFNNYEDIPVIKEAIEKLSKEQNLGD